jgi:hypothetical protein
MSDIFAGQYLDLTLYYTMERNKAGVATFTKLTEEEYNKMRLDEAKKDKARKLETKWLQQSWRAAHDLVTMSMDHNHMDGGKMTFNPHKYRDAKLRACLVDWDAKDNDGSPIPCNESTVNNIHWAIADALLELYDAAQAPDPETNAKN